MTSSEDRFRFNAAPASACAYPMPRMRPEAQALLAALLMHALADSPTLQLRDHSIPVTGGDLDEVSASLIEVLHTRFPLPWEGVEQGVCTIDHALLRDGAIRYRINELYAAYLVSIGASPSASLRDLLRHQAGRPAIGLDDGDCALAIEALQCYHLQQTRAWTAQAVFASRGGGRPAPREAFGLDATEMLLRKLGAEPAP